MENDTSTNQDYMLTVPPTSSIRHSVSEAPSPSTNTSQPAGETRPGATMVGSASNSENNLERREELITRLRRPTSVLAPGGRLRPNNISPSLVTDVELHAQHAQSHSSTPTSNPVVQALGDVFRVPISGYSAPASIGDSTWRTLGFDGTDGSGNTSTGSGTRGQRGVRLGNTAPPSAPASPRQDEVWTGDWAQPLGILTAGDHPVYLDGRQHEREHHEGEEDEGGILVIPSLGDRAVENDVHTLLEVHGIASRLSNGNESSGDNGVQRIARPRPRRMRVPSYPLVEVEDDRDIENIRDVDLDADGEVDADDVNTGSSHGDYEYYPERSSSASHRIRRGSGVGIRQGLGYAEHDFGVEEEEEPGMEDRMDVDVDLDMGGGAEEDCGSEESEDEDDRISTRIRDGTRPSPTPVGPTHSSRQHGTNPTSASISTGSTSTPLPKSSNTSQNPAHNYGYGSLYGYYEDLDLAGICFDPSGERMYVAGIGVSVDGISSSSSSSPSGTGGGNGGLMDIVGAGAVVEWSVRGAEKRWWVEQEGWK